MAEYRLYFLDDHSHIIARVEFVAAQDPSALRIAAAVGESCTDAQGGYALWQGSRQIFATDETCDRSFMRALAAKPLPLDAQLVTLAIEDTLLRSQWRIAQSVQLLQATSRLRDDSRLAS